MNASPNTISATFVAVRMGLINTKGGFNGMVLAVDPAAFGDTDDFAVEVARLSAAVHNLEPAQGNNRVLLPGERGATTACHQRKSGITLARGTVKRLAKLAKTLGVDIPVALN